MLKKTPAIRTALRGFNVDAVAAMTPGTASGEGGGAQGWQRQRMRAHSPAQPPARLPCCRGCSQLLLDLTRVCVHVCECVYVCICVSVCICVRVKWGWGWPGILATCT